METNDFDIFTLDNLLHFLGGALLSGLIAFGFWMPETLVASVPFNAAFYGLLRERAQHRAKDKARGLPTESFGFLKSNHKITEGLMWGVGSLAAMVTGFLIWRL